jgi:hypothetical protein
MGERAGHAYTAVPTHDHDHDNEDEIYRDDSDMQRDQTPPAHAAAKTMWPVKTRWLIISLVLLAVPIVVPCTLAAVNGYKCADYWKGAGVFLFCGTLWASEVRIPPCPLPLFSLCVCVAGGSYMGDLRNRASHCHSAALRTWHEQGACAPIFVALR